MLMPKMAEVEPWGMVTVAGTVAAAVLELEKRNGDSAASAADVRVIVPVPTGR